MEGEDSPASRTTSYQYDAEGNQTCATRASANYTSNIFDNAGKMVEDQYYGSDGTCFGSHTTSYDPSGNAIRESDKASANEFNIVLTEYDALGRVLRTAVDLDDDGVMGGQLVSCIYN